MPVDFYKPTSKTIVDCLRGLAMRRLRGPDEYEYDLLRLSGAAQNILKSAVGSATLRDPEWAGSLTDMRLASQAFLGQLERRSAVASLFDMGLISAARGQYSPVGR